MIIKCEKGKHYYNTVEHSVCPFCVQVEKKINEQKSELNKQEDESICITETTDLLEYIKYSFETLADKV